MSTLLVSMWMRSCSNPMKTAHPGESHPTGPSRGAASMAARRTYVKGGAMGRQVLETGRLEFG